MQSIQEAWHNQIKSIQSERNIKTLGIVGKSSSGIWVEMFITLLPDGNLKLKTAYRYYAEFSGLL